MPLPKEELYTIGDIYSLPERLIKKADKTTDTITITFLRFSLFRFLFARFLTIPFVLFSKGQVIACHLLIPRSCHPQSGQSDLQAGRSHCYV